MLVPPSVTVPPPTVSPWLTREETAAYLRVGPRTVDRLARDGLLTRFHLRRSPRYRRAEVAALVELDDHVGERAPAQLLKAQETVRRLRSEVPAQEAGGDDPARAGH